MTAERQLWEALGRIASERRVELDASPASDLTIPLKGGDALVVPMVLLSTAP